MAAPSVTLKCLQNEDTGIDISVPSIHEEEAPLGGVSILYEISVLTKLDLYKSSLHKIDDVVQFSVFKAYREIEDLYNKLNKKYPTTGLPQIPKSSAIEKYTNEEKVEALDKFMKFISKNTELCESSIFTHFIGIIAQKPLLAASNASFKGNSSGETAESENITKTEDLSNVFPKVKNAAVKNGNKVVQTNPTKAERVDLFEEEKIIKVTETSNPQRTTAGLFDDFEDDNLFSAKPTPKPTAIPKEVEKVPKAIPKKKDPEKKLVPVEIDDSQIIIKDRKLGEISLFDEQDLGDYVTKEEEALFLVTPDDERNKKNTLLFSSNSESVETESELHENLDDLLNLNPLPISPVPKTPVSEKLPYSEFTETEKSADSGKQIDQQPKRPVPLPRKKSLGKSDTDELTMTKPEVMPRKVFLKKTEVLSKTAVSSQDLPKSTKPPPISAKPAVLPKPKPPIKGPKPALPKDTKDLDVINANKPEKAQNENTVSSVAEDLNRLDILKYIEQEQKTFEAEPSLFD